MPLPDLDDVSVDDLTWVGLSPPENCDSLEVFNDTGFGLRWRTPPKSAEKMLGAGGSLIFATPLGKAINHPRYQVGRNAIEVRVETGGGSQTIKRLWS